ncbi:EspA/EspE family type VII secretion system effector [Mycolicibacterium goodii]|uniref:EspA/EspE family type VII secretion system effector n=1 Tax=Mycolicibacterium goodii TaxID=134601 RepID=UPI00093CB3CC|nr:EspA/EspE family type VII secretion system effector [Mycolicibacterium goodii]OKH73210.1 hypothetical protein EB74_20925 [Mycobacterium sp. SWH-M5]PJK23763.1 hypothetical protein CSX11_04095 [Mycolicibacterium goodii]
MGALDGFHSTWNKARETFGQGVPTDGSQFDRSSQLLNLKASVEAAAPDDRWQGSGANAYAAANKEHPPPLRRNLYILLPPVPQPCSFP